MTVVAVQTGWFVAAGLVMWLALALLAGALVAMAAIADHDDAREFSDLPVPAAPALLRAEAVTSPRTSGHGSHRGGQRDRVGAQERAARDALRCHGGRVDVAPVRCPIELQGGGR